jgi:hypothetical protein
MLELQTLEINILWSQSREKARIATRTHFRQTPVGYSDRSTGVDRGPMTLYYIKAKLSRVISPLRNATQAITGL